MGRILWFWNVMYAQGASVPSVDMGVGAKLGRVGHQEHDTDAQHRSRILSLFQTLDHNKTGYLDHDNIIRRFDDLAGAKRRSDRPAGEAGPLGSVVMYARELVKECDKTRDGRITFAEFEQFVRQKEVELLKVFQEIDTSGDNTIQKSELRDFVKAAGIHVTDAELNNLISRFDKDNTGSITFDEWRDFLLLLPHEPTPANIFNFYNSIYNVDVNSDSMPFPETMTDPMAAKRYRYFVCGGLSGAVSRTVTAPLDRLKVLLVTQTTVTPTTTSATAATTTRSNTGIIMEGLKRIYHEGGIRSFYRGNGINVLKIAPESGVKFFTFETMKNFISTVEQVDHSDHISVPGRFLAGGVAGLISQFTIYPLETIKTRIMAQISSSPSSSCPSTSHPPMAQKRLITSTIRSMWAEGGLKTFYRGCIPSLIGIVPYAGIDLGIYETLRSTYEGRLRVRTGRKDAKVGSGYLLGFGAISAACGATIMYPLSVVRTRLQAQGTPSHPMTYTSTFDVIRKTYAGEGLRGFYKGLAPTLLKVLPAVSISYVVYEKTKVLF
ncbi:uncharacterized protein SPPG_05994 [Spizellomyces punctatus DAOM BR117]|uniref:EF-hand domain-containing protein n=1 Tax=Spizellomyces punctatus (strain DAOM BR117) TaxID=645134 RepID=A0A0L0HE57_SPIPD|nr:uncharacterized protein SPPG_05994 [Spizellomyces punctatus DAOM BR117]KNC99043.1 hypothetical protein SPPG_05994 [Spizellomyces punctatus DAOM BR117]|eukprot:XP_016607083.1 hypothetical protein SPPG_05994 [Spizellomyces punctatus DAOM BR117]